MPCVCAAGLVRVSVGAWVSEPEAATMTFTAAEVVDALRLSIATAVSGCVPPLNGVQLVE